MRRPPCVGEPLVLIGIDPGLGGALCALFRSDPDGSNAGPPFVADVIDMPLIKDGKKYSIDGAAICKFLDFYRPRRAFIENVQPMPSIPGAGGMRRSMGAASSFRFGMVVGEVRGLLMAYSLQPEKVHPQVWQRAYGLAGGDKEPHRQKAIELHPEASGWLRRKGDHGRADAILIAKWGHMQIERGLFA